MKKRYEVVVSSQAEQMLLSHAAFLARVSVKAARRLRDEFAGVLADLETNPFQFPPAEEPELPEGYRKALLGKRYQAVFCVDGQTVYLDAVLDCRRKNASIL